MNCPKCGVGVVEHVGYIELDNMAFTYSKYLPQKPALVISLCSRDCDYIEIKATPDAYLHARKMIQESVLNEAIQ